MTIETLTLTDQWDKVFPPAKASTTRRSPSTTGSASPSPPTCIAPRTSPDAFRPSRSRDLFGAVKEQSSGLYAQTMAERGFPDGRLRPLLHRRERRHARRVSSPDINTEDFSAAVDYLLQRDDVDPEAVGIIGICGWGGIALNAAALDPRIKATLATTLHVMTRVATKGYFDADDSADKRMAARQAMAAQRTLDYANGTYERAGGVVDPLPADVPQFVADYAYYKTARGFHARSGNSTDGWNATSSLSWMNTNLLQFASEIENPVMVLHGEKAHSATWARVPSTSSPATTRSS